jgi:cysteine-rich repeat protein
VWAACGDGFTQVDVEACDDGNLSNSDKCLASCKLQSCGDGFIHVGFEQCDDGNSDDADSCLGSCRSARCGDGLVQADVESCDDGNADNTDACLSSCETASCGDGFVQADVESCDDGNADNTDACLSSCEAAPAELPELSTQAEDLDLADFSLQLGAFTSLANAEEFMEAAAQVVPGVRVSRTERNGKPMYRVVLGHYPTAGQAEVIQHTLAMAGMGSLLKVRR